MKLLRYSFGNNKGDKQTILSILENVEVEEYQKIYLTNRIPDILSDDFDLIAIKNKIAFQILRFLALICGVLVPVIVNLNENIVVFGLSKNMWVTILGIISAVSFGFLQAFQNEKVWLHHREMYEVLRTETYKYLTLSGHYNKFENHKVAFPEFAEVIEEEIKRDIKAYTSIIEKREKNSKTEIE